MTNEIVTIPARGGKAVSVRQGQAVKVINTHGEQVVDTWAFNAGDISEFMSMDATRATLQKLIADVGDSYLSNRRRPILTVEEDTSAGIHDTLMAACDNERYGLLGVRTIMTTVRITFDPACRSWVPKLPGCRRR